jgi:SAM-dependent methyltransferase
MHLMLRKLLAHPLTRGMEVDDPRTTALRRRIIRRDGLLRRVYLEWYALVAEALPAVEGQVLEVGSGAGFMDEVIPGLITSDVLPAPGVSVVLDAARLPFAEGALRAIVMTDAFHHMARAGQFLAEAVRCLTPGGMVVMIEPWNTPWGRFVYGRLHPEPFRPESASWELPPGGPLSGANGALPWIVFERDRRRFEREFPQLRLLGVQPLMPFRYLVSGGVGFRRMAPVRTWPFWCAVEKIVSGWMHLLAMFALIRLAKTGAGD